VGAAALNTGVAGLPSLRSSAARSSATSQLRSGRAHTVWRTVRTCCCSRASRVYAPHMQPVASRACRQSRVSPRRHCTRGRNSRPHAAGRQVSIAPPPPALTGHGPWRRGTVMQCWVHGPVTSRACTHVHIYRYPVNTYTESIANVSECLTLGNLLSLKKIKRCSKLGWPTSWLTRTDDSIAKVTVSWPPLTTSLPMAAPVSLSLRLPPPHRVAPGPAS